MKKIKNRYSKNTLVGVADTKLISQDIGMVEDIFEAVKNMISFESHCMGSFISTGNEDWLRRMSYMRKKRTKYLSLIATSEEGQAWCFTPQTKIITNKGLKNIEKIGRGDVVLTHNNRFKKVENTFKREINEEIVEINTNYTNIPLKVTKNHLFYIAENLRTPQKDLWKKKFKKPKFVWKEAEKLSRKDFIYLPRYNLVKDIDEYFFDYINYSGSNQFKESKNIENIKIKINEKIMRLIGLYLAEGHHCEYINKKGWKAGYVGFSFSKKEENLANFIKDVFLSEFNYNIKPLYRESTIEINIGKRVFREFFKNFGNCANNKNIPSWIINLPNKKLICLVNGMFEGDGYLSKFDLKYSTVSEEMAYQLRLILNKLGIICNLSNRGKAKSSKINGREIISKYDIYQLQISGDSARRLTKLMGIKYSGGKKTSGNFGYVGKDYFLIPVLKVDKKNYYGNVYNLEIDEDNSYCTFNGVAHNCCSKHLCEIAMRLQEVSTRFLSTNQLEEAKICSEEAGDMYLLFLELNKHMEKDVSTKSSA